MLSLFLFLLFVVLVFPFSPIMLSLALFLPSLFFCLHLNMFSNSSQLFSLSPSLSLDDLSLSIILLTLLVVFMCMTITYSFLDRTLTVVLLLLILFCIEVFSTMNVLYLYIFYESSLLPILFIIIKWGSYPERSLSALVILIYTLMFGAPFIIVLFAVFSSFSTFNIFFLDLFSLSPSILLSLAVFFTFAVNLPIYGLHLWLPLAHVEAPTFGSVILAALLLNLGGVGMYRSVSLIDLIALSSSFLGYFLVLIIWSFIVCCFQSDFKRLIAYSSVAHMIVIPLIIFSNNLLSFQTLNIVILFHGLSSSLLFMLVGILYSIYGSRQLVLMRGLILVSPLLSFFSILSFFYTISAPPFPSFMAELFFIFSTYVLSSYLIVPFIIIVFLGLLYNLNWLVSILFISPSSVSYSNSTVLYTQTLPFLIVFIYTITSILLFIAF